MGSARETLLLLANNDDMPGFITILKEQITKRPKVDMAEIITELSRKQQKPIWEKMKAVADKLKSDVEPQNYISDDGAKVLQCLSSVIISVIKSDFSDVEDIVPSCSVLYDIIKFISNKDDNVSSLIYSLGEIWWNRNLAGRDKFAKPTIMFLLQKSLLKSIKADVKRVYAMRECLRKISLDDGDACQLIKCATSSLYLKVPQGRKFIAFLMTLSSKLLNMIHGAIKSKLLQCNSVEANSYGEIYVRAWDSMPADGDLRQKIELDCIQDVMYNCIHAPTSTLASTLRKVLCPLHNQRQNYDVGKLLVRLYGPILWRALKVVNSAVRCNAAAILLSTFPLEDPDLNRVELDKEIQTQLNAIEELLYDPSPSVRCVAVMGTYQICNLYWELIPVNVIKSLLTAILENLAFDASSPKVRLSVFKGLIVLLENPLSHAYVGELLMRVQKCFHDLSENVRVVFMEVLLSVKSLKTVKYWKITPPDELLCRLAVDTPPVARRIVSLLFSSYHPISKGDELLLERSISLIMANRQASRCFYRYAHKFMDLKNSGIQKG